MRFAERHARVAARLRERGFTVVEQPGWQDRGAGGRDMSAVEHLTIHHTATGGRQDLPSLTLLTHGRADLTGPLCGWSAGRNGTLAIVAAGRANHAGQTWQPYQSNDRSVGLEAENNGVGEPWGRPIMDAMTAWAQEMRREFNIARDRVQGHKETCVPVGRKIDPANFDMAAFRVASDPPLLTPPTSSFLEDIVAQLNDDEKARFMRFVDTMNRTFDVRQKSKAVGHENDELWLSEGFMWTEANTSRAASASERTNQLLQQLIDLQKGK